MRHWTATPNYVGVRKTLLQTFNQDTKVAVTLAAVRELKKKKLDPRECLFRDFANRGRMSNAGSQFVLNLPTTPAILSSCCLLVVYHLQ
jgi:hypothetical protein